jgi:predicted amidohydrolase
MSDIRLGTPMRVAVAQIEPKLAEKERNLDLCLARLEEAAVQEAELLVLPECALPGYVYESGDEALPYAEEVPGPSTAVLEEACARLDAYVVCGLLERDGDAIHNAAVLVGPDGLVGSYRKSHLPFLGVDRFVQAGEELPVFDTPIGRIGIEICYDLRFPEVTRSLALAGAEIVCLPTNWPVAARANAELLAPARGYENLVYLLVANRVGKERTAEFCGRSQIVDTTGVRLAEADATSEALLVAEIDVARAREKSIVPAPGEYEMHLFGHRRPELYGALVGETQSVTT